MNALAPEPAPIPSVQDLAWLSGCWESVGGDPGSGETWTRPAGGTLLGLSRTVKGGKTVAHELMQIRETGPGRIVFIALPSGQSEATFPLIRLAGQEVVFENPEHDFPQRVIYRRDGDRLTGRIEGSESGREKKAFDFPLKRAACEDVPDRPRFPLLDRGGSMSRSFPWKKHWNHLFRGQFPAGQLDLKAVFRQGRSKGLSLLPFLTLLLGKPVSHLLSLAKLLHLIPLQLPHRFHGPPP